MCGFQNGTWECTGHGYLWDADRDGYDPEDISTPCPRCNTKAYLLNRKEDAESSSCGGFNHITWTGESVWLDAVQCAEQENPAAAAKALAEIGLVLALRPADNAEGYEEVKYFYGAQAASVSECAPRLTSAS